MKLTKIARLRKDDLPGSPDWATRLLTPINSFFENVYLALTNKLSFQDNFNAQIKTITISTPELPYEFTPTITGKPIGVVLCQILKDTGSHETIASAVYIDWSYQNGLITIHGITGIDGTSKYFLTIFHVHR